VVAFEPDRFQPRLNFLRSEVADEGVGGSSGLETSAGVSLLANLFTFNARGPVNLIGLLSLEASKVVKSPLVFERGMSTFSP
jgi:hypothetical protein